MSGDDGRFARFELIEWWDQRRLADARVLVVGAGALGNELVKNLALLGFGHVAIIDFDSVEISNLSRAVLFRPGDATAGKARVAAGAARELYPAIEAIPVDADVVHGVGLGLFRWADVVLGGLDNREARVAVNRACARVGRPWIDGGIDVLSGVVRVFVPGDGPCYECTLGEADWKALSQRHSCSLLNRELQAFGKTPTTPTTASIIAGIQCQEALKLLHGLPTLAGAAFHFEGLTHTSYLSRYERDPDCPNHDPLPLIEVRDARAQDTTARAALAWIRAALGPRACLEFARDLLLGFTCPTCGTTERRPRPLASVTESDSACPGCGERRAPELFHGLYGDEDFLDLPLAGLGLPPWDVVFGRMGDRCLGFELGGDRERLFPITPEGR